MADRTTRVTLTAQVSNYVAGMREAARATREASDSAEQLAARRQAYQTLGVAALAMGTVAAAGIALAVSKFADFDQAMSNVKAATQESTENMSLLREAALAAGADTVYSATEAAGAIEELGKAGLTTQEILDGGLAGALSLAAAGAMDVSEAASVTAISLKQFGLDGDQAGHVADLLAAGAGKAVGDVSDLGAALGQAGLVANGAGQSIEDTTGVLAAFADAGLLGSDAGTSLKTALIALQAPTDKSRSIMEDYNLSFYDGAGKMLSYQEIAGQLENNLSDLTDEQRNAALAQIFGNDALRAANVLYTQGADGIQKYVDQTNDTGYAAKVAADRLDNLKGDVERLGGAFDTFLIQTGSGANDALRGITQGFTFLVDEMGKVPAPVSAAGVAVAAAAASFLLAGGAASFIIPKIVEMKAAIAALGVTGRATAIGIGAVGIAIAGLTIGAGLIISYFSDMKAAATEFGDSLDQTTGAITSYSRELVAKKLAESGAFDAAKKEGISQKELTDAILEGGSAFDEYVSKFGGRNNIVDFFNGSGIAAGNASQTIRDLRTNVEDGQKSWRDQQAALRDSTAATEEQTVATEAMAGISEDATEAVDGLVESIKNFASGQFDMNAAQREFEASVDDATASLEAQKAAYEEANGTLDGFVASLDIGTAEGRENSAALDAIAKSANESAAAIYAQTGSVDQSTNALKLGSDALYAQLAAFGITGVAADEYVAKLLATPGDIQTQVQLNGAEQAEAILDNLTKNRTILIQAAIDSGADPGAAKAAYNSQGGLIPQYLASGGSAKFMMARGTDTVPAMLTPGEYVVNAKATSENLGLLRAINSGADLRADARMGSVSVSPQFNVVVASKGGVNLLDYVDVRIEQADARSEATANAGWRRDA